MEERWRKGEGGEEKRRRGGEEEKRWRGRGRGREGVGKAELVTSGSAIEGFVGKLQDLINRDIYLN